jgi:hypothetical protein
VGVADAVGIRHWALVVAVFGQKRTPRPPKYIFHKEGDFAAFAKLLREAGERTDVRLLAYCLMSNHFHLLLVPHPGRRAPFDGASLY